MPIFANRLVWKWQKESQWQRQVLNKDSDMDPPLRFSCFKYLYSTSSLQRSLLFHQNCCLCLTCSLSACFLPQKRDREKRRRKRRIRNPSSFHCFHSLKMKIYVIYAREWDTVQIALRSRGAGLQNFQNVKVCAVVFGFAFMGLLCDGHCDLWPESHHH